MLILKRLCHQRSTVCPFCASASHISLFKVLGESSEITHPAYFKVNYLEEVVSSGMDIGNYQPEIGFQQQLPETYVDTTAFNVNYLNP